MTQKKHINKILAPTQSRDNPANMFVCFSCPEFSMCDSDIVFAAKAHPGLITNTTDPPPTQSMSCRFGRLIYYDYTSKNQYW